jgi:RNA polymerase sigma-70 factor (ECF subfamily)
MALFEDAPELLAAFREGQPAALERVYRYHVRSLDLYFRTLTRFAGAPELSQPSAIADLLQETFVRAFSPGARAAYDGVRDFSHYLNRIARNGFVDALRKRKTEVLLGPADLPLTAEGVPDGEDGYDPKVVAVLEAYLKELPAPLKSVYEQRFVAGLSQEEACKALRVSRRNLRTSEDHLRRGLRKALLLAGVLGSSPGLAIGPLQASRP